MTVRFDEERRVWRVVVNAGAPGAPRQRRYRDVHAPNTQRGRQLALDVDAELRLEAREAREHAWPGSDSGSGSFADAAAGWVNRAAGRWKPKTLKETRYNLKRYILPSLGATPLEKVSPAQIEQLYAEWAMAGHSASARRRWHGIIRSIFAEAERLGELRGRNPMVRVIPAGGRAPERRPPTPEEVQRIIDNSPSMLARVINELGAATGARRGTLAAVRWNDVDLEAGTVSFVHAIAEGEDGLVETTNKAGLAYAVKIQGRSLEALRSQRVRARETAMALGIPGELGNLYVFSDDGGSTHWSLGWISHQFARACELAGVAGYHLHDLRHFAATRLLGAGLPARVVADRLGCTEQNVIRTYSHRVASAEDARAAEVMAALLERVEAGA